MDALAAKFYSYLKGGLRSEADLPRLRVLAEKLAEKETLKADVELNGYSGEVRNRVHGTLIKLRPEAVRLMRLERQITILSHELRLTPRARYEYDQALAMLE